MTLLVTLFAAVFVTYRWYIRKDDAMRLGLLCLIYWGASLMWLVDAIFEFAELKSAYFTPAPEDMLNDLFLGLCAVALGAVIWIVRLVITDPKGSVRTALNKQA